MISLLHPVLIKGKQSLPGMHYQAELGNELMLDAQFALRRPLLIHKLWRK
jgi:hypothetical protein